MESRLELGPQSLSTRPPAPADDRLHRLEVGGLVAAGSLSGVVGGLALAVPLVIWDWASSTHRALELPMATTAWLFGLEHFSTDENLWWPIVLGSGLLLVYSLASGIAFAALADRVYGVASTAGLLVSGAVWGVVSFVFFWYVLLAIARDGAPFRAAETLAPSTAPTWVWILGFALFGVVTGACFAALRRMPALLRDEDSEVDELPLRTAA